MVEFTEIRDIYAAQFLREADAGIFIELENADQLAEAVESLADDPQLCRSPGQAPR